MHRLRPAGRVRQPGAVVVHRRVPLQLLMSGCGCHVLSASSVPLRLRHRKGHSSPVAIRDAPVTTGRARSFSRGLSSCTEGFHFSYSCSGCGCHVLSVSSVPLRLHHRKGHSSPVAIRDAPVTTGRARSSAGGCRRAPKGSTPVTHVGLRLSCAICEFGSAPVTPQERA